MPDTAPQSALRRKLAPPRPQKMPGQGALEHLFKKTMPRDADELLGLQIGVAAVTPGRSEKGELLKGLLPSDLTYLMTCDGASPGLCIVSHGLLAALTEVQMSGRVSTSIPSERLPTRTDGIVASDIVDRWIASARAEAEAQLLGDILPFRDYIRADGILDVRNADLALEPGEFRTLTTVLELAVSGRTGTLTFALPVRSSGRAAVVPGTAQKFRHEVMNAEVRLNVVLAKLPVSIGRMRGLAPGDLIEVPISALRSVTLETETGETVARARLGQVGGLKAARILRDGAATTPGDQDSEFLGTAESGGIDQLGFGSTQRHGAPELPDLPDFPDLPELPELPELQDLD